MDPLVIIAALQAITAIIRQIEVYSRNEMTEEELRAFHQRVMDFMKAVQVDADKYRS
jgi:hypothetical protein